MWNFIRKRVAHPERRYLDFAAATPVSTQARAAMERIELIANPEGIHTDALRAKEMLERARADVARICAVPASTIHFTSGATEGNNIALQGCFRAWRNQHPRDGAHVVVSAIEHASVLEPIRLLEREYGVRVTYVKPTAEGRLRAEDVCAALTPGTMLVSVGWANGETGVVQPLSTIAQGIRAHEKAHETRILFHSDAGQAPLYLATTILSLGVDVLTLDSGKLYGPRGIGALYVKDSSILAPITFGGGQEAGLRPGTVPLTLAVGFAAALTESAAKRKEESARLSQVRATFMRLLKSGLGAHEQLVVNSPESHTLPHIVNFSLKDIDAEYVALMLDGRGLSISTKSSCEEGERESHVVRAMVDGADAWRAQTTLRFSFGVATRDVDAQHAAEVTVKALDDYRNLQK